MSSPSQQYARYQEDKRRARTPLGAFAQQYPFELDPFQNDACDALTEGESVLVAAPTGAGKTVVGQYAVHLALTQGRKVFYTAPIKALSNQKHAELSDWLGPERVGLLTGDVSLRPEADVVVMTTEVLRNMMYAGSQLLDELGYVVMDEVHYLADRLRGPVWEEVIIGLDPSVQLVALSATVSNAEEFGTWIQEMRGTTRIVVSEDRPVPLQQHVMVGHELIDLYEDPDAGTHRKVNPVLVQALHGNGGGTHAEIGGGRGADRGRGGGRNRHGHGGRGGHRSRGRGNGPRGPVGASGPAIRAPRRADVVRVLDREALLPAIFFIFSRAGCDASVRQLEQSGVRLTTEQERGEIRAVLDEHLAAIGYEDEQILDLERFRRAAEAGFAAHHAGMLPLLKVCVEQLFGRGLIKVVFATETLALGINMPARTVVLSALSKFNGTEHADLTPGEYTQLTGRAGRRGIDVEGHAVVLATAHTDPAHVATLAGKRTYPLRSAFRPTANMAVNMLAMQDRAHTRELLEMSFAQFQTDRSVLGPARRARELERNVEDYRQALVCDQGDLLEYAALRDRVSTREKELSQQRARDDRDRTRKVLRGLRRGEILAVPGGRRAGYAVVLDVDREAFDGPAVQTLTAESRLRTLRPGDVPSPPAVIDSMRLPRQDRMGTARIRKDTAAALRQKLAGRGDARKEVRRQAGRTPSTAAEDQQLADLRSRLHAHPCHTCPDLPAHERWLGRWTKARKDLASVQRRIASRTGSLAREFDRLAALLVELGYLEPVGTAVDGTDELTPTPSGMRLRRLFSDRDLLIAQCLEEGAWDELDPAGLAALVSAATYDARRDDVGAPEHIPSRMVDEALTRTTDIADSLAAAQRRHGLDATDPPDPSVAPILYRWAQGAHLAAAIDEGGPTPGDFVRHCRQVIDLLRQLTEHPHVGLTARHAIVAVRRGLVAQEMDR
jgi:ATP-dependent RNA helicase HelY